MEARGSRLSEARIGRIPAVRAAHSFQAWKGLEQSADLAALQTYAIDVAVAALEGPAAQQFLLFVAQNRREPPLCEEVLEGLRVIGERTVAEVDGERNQRSGVAARARVPSRDGAQLGLSGGTERRQREVEASAGESGERAGILTREPRGERHGNQR